MTEKQHAPVWTAERYALVGQLVALVCEQTALTEAHWHRAVKRRRGAKMPRTKPTREDGKKRREMDEHIVALAAEIRERWPSTPGNATEVRP